MIILLWHYGMYGNLPVSVPCRIRKEKALRELLAYKLENPDITVRDERILDLAGIVEEVKQSEEWEAVKMNILEIGLAQGIEKGIEQGIAQGIEKGIEQGIERGLEQGAAQVLVRDAEALMRNLGIDLKRACEGLGISVEEYHAAKEKAGGEKGKTKKTSEGMTAAKE